MIIFVTGGSGFIGSNFIRLIINKSNHKVINIDKLTYAGNKNNLLDLIKNKRYFFEKADIANKAQISRLFSKYKPNIVINFAAESHVDRSIHGPKDFIHTNIQGVFNLLEIQRNFYNSLTPQNKRMYRFIHISTDEVYGSLTLGDSRFNEENQYRPNSPYSASKASSDHLVRAWNRTYGLPTIITNCSNNYGPYQYPEKFIPLCILNILENKPIPIYGDGSNIRDWIYVDDHCRAIKLVMDNGKVGEVYNIGSGNEVNNLEIAKGIYRVLNSQNYNEKLFLKNYIKFVKDRLGHDYRYAINASKIKKQLGWKPEVSFNSGLKKTVEWYLENLNWVKKIKTSQYTKWIQKNYE